MSEPRNGSHDDGPPDDELIDGLIALIEVARRDGRELTVQLLEMALLNETKPGRRD